MKKRAAYLTLGCKVNQYETDAMKEILEKVGYETVDFKDQADVYIINTCSVTNMADRKSRQMISRARKKNPAAVIVAAGCYVQAREDQVMEQGMADILLGNNRKKDIADILEEYFHRQ
ncbi:MAG: tRNA (N(6)-L-threonylcarbamoyladenosine(37)-C(2))-methylthiotransferase MtaB, partial [Eubacterium sp.]|nr:tRNA (N(6)-L-threonylcarbamoyladenosine(37)-C(2))-methylthiotransferase MtaB [Eubacterium sp.]